MRRAEVLYLRGAAPRRAVESLAPLLVPASWVYGALSDAVRRVRSLETPERPAARVVSVGNIEVGGSGKTPVVMELLGSAVSRGHRGTYVSRAFRSRAERFDGVTVVAPRGEDVDPIPGIRVLRRDHPHLAAEIGDEAAMVVGRLPGVSLALSRRKSVAVAVAGRLFAPAVIVLDDAFQSWGVHRDVDLVLVNPWRPFGNGRLLPAGTLREEATALSRADVVIVNGPRSTADSDCVRRAVRELGVRVPVTELWRSLEYLDDRGERIEPESLGPVAVVSAVARPEAFEEMVDRSGVSRAISLRYPDHHPYTFTDREEIARHCEARGIGTVVVTEKDRVKLGDGIPGRVGIVVARLCVRFSDTELVGNALKPRPEAAASHAY